ncbi:MAG: serine palmitoyltransferase component [Alectoria sarmentosa]|nr:MAG: serine palmitoyltransferase component [Alectoria sarmentosa]
MDLQDVQSWLNDVLREASVQFHKVPGSAIFLRYVKSSYQNDPVRSAVELFLVLFAIRYLAAPAYSTQKKSYVTLSEEACHLRSGIDVLLTSLKEVDELVDEWTPEPLVAPQTTFEEAENEKRPVIVGPTGPKSKLSNGRTVANLASYNFYNLVSNETLKEKAIQVLRTYGVGPCSPPGFYGTQDVHIKTEADIAAHLGTPACIVYAQAFSTISSVISAFSKRGDIIVADRAVNYAIRKGIQISRSTIRWYDHNDLQDLQRVLERVVTEQAKKPLTRRFIITEGLFENVGDMIDLPKIIAFGRQYKFRLILDETWSFGVLGRTGRGITEHQNVDAAEVDMIVGSLAGPLCAGGGFCAGSDAIVEHQRISASAYTFSAALPAMLATTASEVLSMLQTSPEMLTTMRENIKTMWAQLDPRSDWVHCTSSADNPIMILAFKPDLIASKKLGGPDQEQLFQEVVDETLANGVLITRLKSMPRAINATSKDVGWELQPALKVCVTSGLSKKEIERAGITIRHAITKIVNKRR